MKTRFILALLSITLFIGDMNAQSTISLGTYSGSGSTNVLLSTSTTSNRYSRTMSIYTAAEIYAAGGSAGDITSLAWDKSGTGEYTTNDAYIKVYLNHISTQSTWATAPMWDNIATGATEVFTSSNYSIPTGIGWKAVPFTNTFTWNGVDNIVIMVEWDRSSAPSGAINWGRSTNPDANATRVGSASLAALAMLINGNRPLVQLTLSGGTTPQVSNVTVSTQNNVPATITTDGGTLQMEATVSPLSVSQSVTWSIINGTGEAIISATGLVTADENGTVWAKAVSVQDPNFKDSMLITITNQLPPAVTNLTVSTQNNVPSTISTDGGTLQMEANIAPSNANQNVTWSIVFGTGEAAISATGLVTAEENGTVWAKAVSVQNPSIKDSMEITITNQVTVPTDLTITVLNSAPPAIDIPQGTLQLLATVLPSNAAQNVDWVIVSNTGNASISNTGLVTAIANGSVWAKASSVNYPNVSDSLEILITNQNIGLNQLVIGENVSVYPVPFQNELTIKFNDEQHEGAKVQLSNMTGQVLLTQKILESNTALNTSKLSPGIYILSIVQNGEVSKIQIVKQ